MIGDACSDDDSLSSTYLDCGRFRLETTTLVQNMAVANLGVLFHLIKAKLTMIQTNPLDRTKRHR